MKINPNLKWALVLSGGGAKGLAHIGVLNALTEMGVPEPSLVVGTSMGAIVGGLYACGMSPGELTRFVTEEFNITEYLDSFVFRIEGPVGKVFQTGQILGNLAVRPGIDSGQRLLDFFEDLTGRKTFEETKIPFRCNAVDLVKGAEIVFSRGSVARAMRASMSFPVFFEPLIEGSMCLIDGGIADNMPVSIARNEGFKRVLAVNVASFADQGLGDLKTCPQIVFRTMETMLCLKKQPSPAKADLTIHAANKVTPFSFLKKRELIALGEQAVHKGMDAVEAFFSGHREGVFFKKRYRECGIRE
jgi:NTE family protein